MKKNLIRFFVKKGGKRLIKGITDFCPVCHDKLRTHGEKRLIECIEKLFEIMGSRESRIHLDPRERN